MDSDHEIRATFSMLPRYNIRELPPLEGVSGLTPRGINARGDVVGQYHPRLSGANSFHAFLYDAANQTVRRIADTDSGVAFAINERQQVAITIDGQHTRGYRWEGGTLTDIGLVPGNERFPSSYGTGINTNGWVVGWSANSSGTEVHAVLWDGNILHDLSPDVRGPTAAMAINSLGQVVGSIRAPDGIDHAALFADGRVQDLGTLGRFSSAVAINDRGRIVGSSDAPSGEHGFIYDLPFGPMQDISPTRPSTLSGVNAAGEAVGALLDLRWAARAILWREGNTIDLTDAVGDGSWTLLMASAINDSGTIAGWGTHNGYDCGFVLTPR